MVTWVFTTTSTLRSGLAVHWSLSTLHYFLPCKPAQTHPFQLLPDIALLDRFEHVGGEGVGQQLPRQIPTHTTTLHIEERLLIESPNRRAVRALHVVGEDLQLRLRVDLGLAGEKQGVVRLLPVRFLRDRMDVHLAVEHAVRLAVEHALVQLPAEAVRLRVYDERLVIAVLLAVQHVQ